MFGFKGFAIMSQDLLGFLRKPQGNTMNEIFETFFAHSEKITNEEDLSLQSP